MWLVKLLRGVTYTYFTLLAIQLVIDVIACLGCVARETTTGSNIVANIASATSTVHGIFSSAIAVRYWP